MAASPDNNGVTTGNIPHSGVGGYEQPVNEFDNTSLEEAVNKGLITTPETPAALHEKQDSKLGTKILAGIAVAAVIVGIPVGKALLKREARDMLSQDPAASAPAIPGQVSSPETETSQENIYHFSLGEDSFTFLSSPGTLTDSLLEDVRLNPPLSPEDISSWNNGVADEQNAIASVYFANRLTLALKEISGAKALGQNYDISYVTSDPKATELLERVSDHFDTVTELETKQNGGGTPALNDILFCRTNTDFIEACNEAPTSNFAPSNGSTELSFVRISESDGWGDGVYKQDGKEYAAVAHILMEGVQTTVTTDGHLVLESTS